MVLTLVTLNVLNHNLMLPTDVNTLAVLETVKLVLVRLTLDDHVVSRVCYCRSVRLCARHQTHVTDIMALPAVI